MLKEGNQSYVEIFYRKGNAESENRARSIKNILDSYGIHSNLRGLDSCANGYMKIEFGIGVDERSKVIIFVPTRGGESYMIIDHGNLELKEVCNEIREIYSKSGKI